MGLPAMPTADLAAALADYLGDIPVTDSVSETVEVARAMVEGAVGTAEVPRAIAHLAVIKTAAELWWQRDAPNGVRNFLDADGAGAIRVARDPLAAARPILRPYIGLGLA